MAAPVTTDSVWRELERQLFAVLGWVTPRGESRTAGIVYVVHERKLYVGTGRTSWKARHIAGNPGVSMTVTIPKRLPFLPWIRIPAATISFHGTATLRERDEVPEPALRALLQGIDPEGEAVREMVVVEIAPEEDFVTYGVGVSLLTMRDTDAARGRAPVA